MKSKYMVNGIAILILLLLPAVAVAKLPLTLDHASFRIAPERDSAYTEFYYGVSRDGLTFKSFGDTLWAAAFEAQIAIADTLGQPVDSLRKWVATKVRSEDETRRAGVRVFDVIHAYLPPGVYDVTLTVTDVESKDAGTVTSRMLVSNYGQTDHLALSDIQLAYKVRYVGDSLSSPKIKNGYFVEPNPSGLFVPEDSVLHFYSELYNIGADPQEFNVHIWVLKANGDVVKDLGVREVRRPGESALLTYGILVSNLEAGNTYMLALEVDHGEQSSAVKKTFALQSFATQGPAATAADEEFTEELAEMHRHFMAYIATADELAEYKVLSLEGKRRFVLEFWKRRDPDPSTARNEFFQEHARRFNLANDQFSRSVAERDDGWNTDRGRIFILYGPPDEIIYSPSSIDALPWERWEYRQLEGGSFFIFLDENNLGLYRLVHSNKQGELQDPEWELKLEREGMDVFR